VKKINLKILNLNNYKNLSISNLNTNKSELKIKMKISIKIWLIRRMKNKNLENVEIWKILNLKTIILKMKSEDNFRDMETLKKENFEKLKKKI